MSLNKSSKYIKTCSLFLLFISLRDEIKESKSARKRGKLKGDLSHFCLWMKNFAFKIKDKEVNNILKGKQLWIFIIKNNLFESEGVGRICRTKNKRTLMSVKVTQHPGLL